MDFAVDFTVKTAKGLARADFDEGFGTESLHGLGAVDPEDRAGSLFDQVGFDISSTRFDLAVDVGYDGDLGIGNGDVVEDFGQPFGSRFHERAVERSTDVKEDSPFGTGFLHGSGSFFDGFGTAGDDDLAGAVEVDGLDRAALGRNLSTDVFDLIFSQAELPA